MPKIDEFSWEELEYGSGGSGGSGKDGADGKDGANGKDGVSATHSWNGTTLTITSASGTSSANLKGEKPLVLNFWATWCAPCVREMPLLDEFAKQHPEIQFVGFTIDSLKNMQKFEQQVQVTYPLLVAGSRYLRLIKQLGNPRGGLPFTLVFDEKGEVKSLLLGEIEKEQLISLIDDLKSN